MKIRTTKIAPTDTQGSKIRAKAEGRQITRPYDHGARDPHEVVAAELAGGPVKKIGEKPAGFIFEKVED